MRLSTFCSGFPRILGFSEFFLIEEGMGDDLIKLSVPRPTPLPPSSEASGSLSQKQHPAVVVMTARLAWLLWV